MCRRPKPPGRYIEETADRVPSIAAAPTSITAFVGRTRRGPVDRPVRVRSSAEFDRHFGGLWRESTLSYAVHHYFLNGGADAIVVRVFNDGPAPSAATGGAPSHRRGEEDGLAVAFEQIAAPELAAARRGIWALDHVDGFNLLCIPPFAREVDVTRETWTAAVAYCRSRRAMLVVDPPSSWTAPDDVLSGTIGIDASASAVPARDANACVFFPRIRVADPLQDNRTETFAPSGAIAGVLARTDAERGVWKAPAGRDAALVGVREPAYPVTDEDNGRLNLRAVNVLRSLPGTGTVVWGARTMAGADRMASEWKYIPVRRLALHLEESLHRGTEWAAFEPNDETLWTRLRQSADGFMHEIFRQGAFQGRTPRDAWFVKCDAGTTTRSDIDQGIVNLVVGFAPLKPAEFVVLRISRIAGQAR